jgi:hypothetical protein
VVGSWSRNEDLLWARENCPASHRDRNRFCRAVHSWLPRRKERHDGVSVHRGAAFYDHKPRTLAILVEYGGLCGAISRFGTAVGQAFGVPALCVTQPGHCAFIWKQSPVSAPLVSSSSLPNVRQRALCANWFLDNDISGWSESGRHDGIQLPCGDIAAQVPFIDAAHMNKVVFDQFVRSERLRFIAKLSVYSASRTLPQSFEWLVAAVRFCPSNILAWQDCVDAFSQISKHQMVRDLASQTWISAEKNLIVDGLSTSKVLSDLKLPKVR